MNFYINSLLPWNNYIFRYVIVFQWTNFVLTIWDYVAEGGLILFFYIDRRRKEIYNGFFPSKILRYWSCSLEIGWKKLNQTRQRAISACMCAACAMRLVEQVWETFVVVLKGRKVSVVTLKMQAPRVDTAIYSFEFISSAPARRGSKCARARYKRAGLT